MTQPRLFISAPRKSSGKTVVSIGLTAALRERGLTVQTFKKGPDFIDPLWLSGASGRPCHNLDLFMMGEERVQENLLRYGRDADFCLVESNMGFFDGQDPEGRDSGAGLAALLATPVVLVVDCRGLARSVAPLVLGHLHFPGGESIAGVILNNVASPRHEGKVRGAVERYCGVPVLGVLPVCDCAAIEERHLGLMPAAERSDFLGVIAAIRDHVKAHVDLERVLELAARAPALDLRLPAAEAVAPASGPPLRVAYAEDQAFHFYYAENLEALRERGVELVPVSLLADTTLPAVDGLFIGGGFPEMFMESLAANRPMIAQVRAAAAAGMPIYAECGGLMYLAETLHWQERSLPMAGALPVEVTMFAKPQGYGYMEIEAAEGFPWPPRGVTVRCHEFHHSAVTRIGEGVGFAYRVKRGTGVEKGRDGLMHRNILASYAHIHAHGAPQWADFLVDWWKQKYFYGKTGERGS